MSLPSRTYRSPLLHEGCGCLPSRRAVLAGVAAAGASGLISESSRAASRSSGVIDVHHHFNPNDVIPGGVPPELLMPSLWNLTKDLEDMDRGGVATAVLSWFPPPGAPDAARRRVARAINEAGARLVADHPGKFALLATLPIPDIDASLAEADYGLDKLGALGVCMPTNDGARWLGDAHFEPPFAELNRRKAVIIVHPLSAACCRNLVAGVPDVVIEYGADTTRCIASLIFGGMTTRYPDVRLVFCHGGGATMAVIERFVGGSHGQIVRGIDTRGVSNFAGKLPPAGALSELRRMYFDTAQATNGAVLGALKTVVSTSQILYGTDVGFQTAEVTTRQLRASRVFKLAELRAVERGNALRLFPRLAA